METQNKSLNPPDAICQELLALLPAYSLGVTTPDEDQRVRALLPLCPDAASVLADYQIISDNLVALFPSNEQPPSSAALLQRVRASAAPMPIASHVSHSIPLEHNPPTRRVEQQPIADPPLSPPQIRRSWSWLALAACFVLAFVGTNVYWASQIDTLRRDQQAFLQTLATRQPEATLTLNTLNHHRALLPTADNPGISAASFVWNSTDQIGALVVDGLPMLSQGQTYQLWLVKDEQSLSLGTFEVDDTGLGVLIFQASAPIESFSHIGVNIEPVGGTVAPTTPHLVIGNI